MHPDFGNLGTGLSKVAGLRTVQLHRSLIRAGFVPKQIAALSAKMPELTKTNPELAAQVNEITAGIFKLRAHQTAKVARFTRKQPAAPPPAPSLWRRLFGGHDKTAAFHALGSALASSRI